MSGINYLHGCTRTLIKLLLTLVVLKSALINAQDDRQPLKIAAIEYNPPFTFTLPDGSPAGLYIEMWELWSDTTGQPIEWVLSPLAESIATVKSGEAIHSGIFINDTRKEWADFSTAFHEIETGVIYSNKVISPLPLADASDYTVAVLKGSFQDQFIAQNFPKLRRHRYTSSHAAVEKLLTGELQAIVGELPLLNNTFATMGLKGLFSTSEILFTNTTHAAIPKGRSDLLASINQGWSEIPIQQLIALEKKWLSANTPYFTDKVSFDALTLEEQQWLSENSSLTLGVEHNYYPIEYLDDNNNLSGLVADYVQFATDSLDLSVVQLTQYEWVEAFELLKQQKIDFMGGVVRNEERAKDVIFTEPYFTMPSALVTKQGNFLSRSLGSYEGLKIGAIRGYSSNDFLRNNYPQLIIIDVDDALDGLRKVSSGEIDAYIGAFQSVKISMDRNSISDLNVASITDYTYDFSFAVRKGLEPLVPILNKVFASMSEKQKQTIANTWLQLQLQQGFSLIAVLKWVIPILLLIMAITVYVLYNNRRLSSEIEQRKRIESKLIRATNEAESANEAKSEFLANMSHEIRTPMNAVLGMCQVLKDSELSTEQKKNLQVIHASTDTLLMLVNDILDISKIESGKIDLESRIFELKTVLDHLEAQINLLINKHRVSFTINVDENVPDLLKGDSLRLGQILLNICNNAAKFTLQGRIELKINVVEQGDESIILKFIVTDTGIGMDQKQISKIFKTYSQADSSISRIYGGTGLGLMITKHLVELMDGHIWVDSVYGEGSSFGFQITQTAVSESSASEYMQRHNVDTVNASQSHVTKLQDKRVLVVDDNRVNLMVATKLLTMVGVKVDQAENGQTAQNLCQTNRYDAVLMDLQMPIMDGYAATLQIKKQRENNTLPIIALSANVMQADIDKCYAVGMNDHIPKPLSMEKLYGTLASYIN